MPKNKINPVELGCPGHFILARECLYRRHTQVGNYRISTIGNLYDKDGVRRSVGFPEDSFFETMIFLTNGEPEPTSENCGCKTVVDYCEIETHRCSTAGEAHLAHERLVKKYLKLAREEARSGASKPGSSVE